MQVTQKQISYASLWVSIYSTLLTLHRVLGLKCKWNALRGKQGGDQIWAYFTFGESYFGWTHSYFEIKRILVRCIWRTYAKIWLLDVFLNFNRYTKAYLKTYFLNILLRTFAYYYIITPSYLYLRIRVNTLLYVVIGFMQKYAHTWWWHLYALWVTKIGHACHSATTQQKAID